MAREKKSGSKDRILQAMAFATAIANLIQAVFDLIESLLE